MRVYLCRCLFLRKQVRILYFPHEKQRKGSADKPDSRRCSFPQEMEEAGGVQRGLKSGFAWDICLVSTEHLICAFST